MKRIATDTLEIAYLESGPEDGDPVILMHGFPYDVHSYDDVAEKLSEKGFRCLTPYLRGFGPTRFLSDGTMRSGEQAALGADLLAFMDELSIKDTILAGYDWGGRAACIVAALWPERVRGLVSCGVGYNIQDIANAGKPVSPEKERDFWYIYYFNTDRGRAALETQRGMLSHYIWKLWSPNWNFDQATFEQSSESFENPDFVEIVTHSYRHRLGGIPGDESVAHIEAQLAEQPMITVPSIVIQGTGDSLDPAPQEDDVCHKFSGPYERRILKDIGHNPPQEDPEAFVDAILTLTSL